MAFHAHQARKKAFFTLLLEWAVGYDQKRLSLISAGSSPPAAE
jgi:hypothetical protein